MKVKFTATAKIQFLKAIAHIKKDKPEAALRFRKKAETALRRLLKFPDSGRVLPEFPELPYREVIISPFRFFYRVRDKNVWIVAVWHGAQLPRAPGDLAET